MIVTDTTSFQKRTGGRASAIALGYFDGLHLAHQKIIGAVVRQKSAGLLACVHTFSKPPKPLGSQPGLLLSSRAKSALLAQMGVDCEIVDNFTEALKHMPPETFFKQVLIDSLNARFLAAGYDYRFGYQKAGDSRLLVELGKRYGVQVEIMQPVACGGQVVSSTLIRSLLQKGRVKEAAQFLGYPFFLQGTVQNGRQIGRTMDIRTANLKPDPWCLLPARGVYVTRCHVEGRNYKSLTNIGNNPTVGGKETTVETHLLEFGGELYGKEIRVEFLDWIRGEIQFPSKEALRAQIERDIAYTKQYDYEKQCSYSQLL